jgi:hypothetical protein
MYAERGREGERAESELDIIVTHFVCSSSRKGNKGLTCQADECQEMQVFFSRVRYYNLPGMKNSVLRVRYYNLPGMKNSVL